MRQTPTLRILGAMTACILVGGCGDGIVGSAGSPSPSGTGAIPSYEGGSLGAEVDAGTEPPPDAGIPVSSAAPDAGEAGEATGGGEDLDAANEAGPEASAPGVPSDASPVVAVGTTEFAPYFPDWIRGGGYAFSGLVDFQKQSGQKQVTLAFVLSGGGCGAKNSFQMSDVKSYVAAGGRVKASFGGASGKYVESGCSDANSLATAISNFVDSTGITDLDFDIEQGPMLTDAANAMRGQALKLVQDSKHIKVAFTLEAVAHTNDAPGGLTSRGVSVVSSAVAAGVQVSHVNLMVMDYGDNYKGQPMAPIAIGSLTDANAQLLKIIPGLTEDQAWAMLGATPDIGQNDDAEIFTLADGQALAQFAIDHKLGLLTFWSAERDLVCGRGGGGCSGVDKANFDFIKILQPAAN